MSNPHFRVSFASWSAKGQPLVLASVYETAGSTYSKAGAMMLMTGEGKFQGMLSGGCLEGDLAMRASAVASTGVPQTVTYDLGSADSDLWGLGVGCDGLIKIFLQAINVETGYQPLAAILAADQGTQTHVAVSVISSERSDLPPGSSLVMNERDIAWSNIPDSRIDSCTALALQTLRRGNSHSEILSGDDGHCLLLISVLRPIPRVLVLGAGPDAEPLVRFISELGWRAWVIDHRPAYIASGDFSSAEHVECVDASQVSKRLILNDFNAAVVMSHHLLTDEAYLRQLAESTVSYVGLLGPKNRRKRLLGLLGDDGKSLQNRLHGPAGIDIHASGPAAIALSIVAEMHQQISD